LMKFKCGCVVAENIWTWIPDRISYDIFSRLESWLTIFML